MKIENSILTLFGNTIHWMKKQLTGIDFNESKNALDKIQLLKVENFKTL